MESRVGFGDQVVVTQFPITTFSFFHFFFRLFILIISTRLLAVETR